MNRFKQKNESIRVLHTEPDVCLKINKQILAWMPNTPREYVVVCIGTDRSTGDALGPLTGYYLKEMKPRHMSVYGTLQNPVHATNLEDYVKTIEQNHRNPFIIAVDACLGKATSVGSIIAENGPVRPGAALNKSLPSIGDIHLTGVVNISGFMEYSVLQNTRLSLVVEMAKTIASTLDEIDQQLTSSRTSPAIVISQMENKERTI